jgi:integrase
MAALLAACVTPEESAAVHLGLFCGLRRGEILALKHRDIEAGDNGSGGRIHVRRALSAGQVGTPKTDGSTRTVDAPRDVLDALERLRETDGASAGDFVFRTPKGTPVDADNFNARVWSKLRKRAGLRASIGLHSLRHSFASLLIDNGENIKYVSRQLGHASASFTLDVYGHCFQETGDRAMASLQKAIRATKRRRFEVVG